LNKNADGLKLNDFGAAEPVLPLSKEDERSAALAARALKGDYDNGEKRFRIGRLQVLTSSQN
jgi:hypothetical protein